MVRRLLASLLATVALAGGQNPPFVTEVFNPPLTSGSSGYADFPTYIAPQITPGGGILVYLAWSAVDNGTTAPCPESTCNWATFDSEIQAYVNYASMAGKYINLGVALVPENTGINTTTPGYVFSAAWATTLGSAPQDQAVDADFPGDASNPACGAVGTGGGLCPTPANGVWNVTACSAVPTGSCPNTSGSLADTSGYPVLYETPFMVAAETFLAQVVKHYSSHGSGSGPTLAPHIGYIRVGFGIADENIIYTAMQGATSIWPSPAGLGSSGVSWFASATSCTTGPSCRGKDALMWGLVNGPGYEDVFASAVQSAIKLYNPRLQAVGEIHKGPPNNSDIGYANTEAAIFAAHGFGFGMNSLGVGDPYNYGLSQPCTANWCGNYTTYGGRGLPLYLQTTYPTLHVSYALSSITVSAGTATATCSVACTSGTGGVGSQGLGAANWGIVSGTDNPALNTTVLILSTPGSAGTQFTYSTSATSGCTVCGTILQDDYLPLTVPFARQLGATKLEIYWCQWVELYDPNTVTGCNYSSDAYGRLYQSAINPQPVAGPR